MADSAFTPLKAFFDKLSEYRSTLPCPGNWDSLHREIKGTLPADYMIEGAKVDLSSMLSPSFQVTHSFAWGSAMYPSSYHFAALYAQKQSLLQGRIDDRGNLSGVATYNWNPSKDFDPAGAQPQQTDPNAPPTPPTPPPQHRPGSTSKVQGQLSTTPGQSRLIFEHDYVGSDHSFNLKAVDPNFVDRPSRTSGTRSTTTGDFKLAFLQSLSNTIQLGLELNYARPTPDATDPLTTTYAIRHSVVQNLNPPPAVPPSVPSPFNMIRPSNPADPTEVLAASFTPAAGLWIASYWRRINQRLEVAAELQMLATAGSAKGDGRREGIATVGFKLDTPMATVRGSVTSGGHVQTIIEERLTPGLSLHLSGDLDYGKGGGGQGRVGLGFTFES
ncbi:eukaryotic porin/Tom40 [Cladochytrium replicatum]|nr:eukaryotic porin/Tom40 [Cladochytrium replicatum]